MAKSINDAGWGQFLRFLEEACTRKGVNLVKAPRFYASVSYTHLTLPTTPYV